MTAVVTLGAALLIAFVAVLAVAHGGWVDVSARQSDGGLLHWFLATTRASSVERHAAGIEVPALDAPEMRRAGIASYAEMCAGCHGAPGREDSVIRRGLHPAPPSFLDASTVRDLDPAGAYWVIDNGIRMSGMPAFGLTHSDDDIWALVVAVRELPSLSTEEYRRAATAQGGNGHDHEHGMPGQDEHGTGGDETGGDDHGDHEHGR